MAVEVQVSYRVVVPGRDMQEAERLARIRVPKTAIDTRVEALHCPPVSAFGQTRISYAEADHD